MNSCKRNLIIYVKNNFIFNFGITVERSFAPLSYARFRFPFEIFLVWIEWRNAEVQTEFFSILMKFRLEFYSYLALIYILFVIIN